MKSLLHIFCLGVFLNPCKGSAFEGVAPRFTLVEERTSKGTPSISITFADGQSDMLILDKYYSNEEDRMAQGHLGIPNMDECIYSGHLADEPEACVAMTGCAGSDDVELTILSDRMIGSHMFKWTKDGDVEVLNRFDDPVVIPRNGTDSEIIPELEESFIKAEEACVGDDCMLPPTQLLQIRVGYDDLFLSHYGGLKILAMMRIVYSWVHIQAYYCHYSLGSKVKVELLMPIKHYNGVSLPDASSASLSKMKVHTQNDIGNADLMLYMGLKCTDCQWGGGRAYIGTVCTSADHLKHSVNMYGTSYAMLAESMAHEIGHNLGMHHDFAENHGSGSGNTGDSATSTNACNGQGFMSYGHHLAVWSDCSVKDFTAQFTNNKDNWCLPSTTTACGGSAYQRNCHDETGGWSCCTSSKQCGIGEGDCDNDSGCFGNLKCGYNNCNAINNNLWDSEADCCYKPNDVASGCHDYDGSWDCCTYWNQCSKGEGDCDWDYDCKGSLKCGSDNCHKSLGYPSWADCCYDDY